MRVYTISLGCAKNRVDSERILGLLNKNNILLTNNIKEADICLINTCAFINQAKQEAIDTILDVSKNKNKDSKLIVVGCLSQRYFDEVSRLLPEVDRFIKIDDYDKIGDIISELFDRKIKLDNSLSFLDKLPTTAKYMQYIKISEGCLNRCSFCAIPHIRGNLVSRTIENIKEEVLLALKNGVYEINLISQDTTRYGYDLYKENKLSDLLEELILLPYDFKIRLLYLYPDLVDDRLIDIISKSDKIYKYFDIPIQHSESNLLKLMNRRGNKEDLINLFNKIREKVANPILRTTIIVGFPNESDEDFSNLISFIKDVKFDHLGCFTFSKEENTKSFNMKGQIPKSIKNKRYDILMKEQQQISLNKKKEYIGKIISCFIVDYIQSEYYYLARNEMFGPDDIDGYIVVYPKYEHNIGDRITVEILDCEEYALIAKEHE